MLLANANPAAARPSKHCAREEEICAHVLAAESAAGMLHRAKKAIVVGLQPKSLADLEAAASAANQPVGGGCLRCLHGQVAFCESGPKRSASGPVAFGHGLIAGAGGA